MALLSDYSAGTISLEADGLAVTGSGTAWLAAGFGEGDLLIANGYFGLVGSVQSNTALTLAQSWRGGALSGAAYRLRYQGDGSRISAQARQLIELLGGSGNLEALGGLQGIADRLAYFTGAGQMGLATLTTYARTLLEAQDKNSAIANLGAQKSLGFDPVQQGGGTGQGTNKIAIGWASDDSGLLAQVDDNQMGKLWTDALVSHDPAARRALLDAQKSLGFSPVQQGGGTGQGTKKVAIGWASDDSGLLAQVDDNELGKLWTDALVSHDPAARRTQLDAQKSLGFDPVQQGGGTGQGVNKIAIGWASDASGLLAQVDYTSLGKIWTAADTPQMLSGNGFQKLPGGLIIQWGTVSNESASDYRASFPVAFPNACLSITLVADNGLDTAHALSIATSQVSASNFDVRSRAISAGSVIGHVGTAVRFIAVGF